MDTKKITIAFIWHLHQPCYKDPESNIYMMPWVRLHAVKDYLNMLLILDNYPSIKQTFNIVPLLLEQIEDYTTNNAHDLHSQLTISDVEKMDDVDKSFILNNFFDVNYTTMVFPNKRYFELYEKRQEVEDDISAFSNQEYSDILMWFNLVWHKNSIQNDEIDAFLKKEKNFTLQDRIRLIEIQRELMGQIIPEYKKRLKNNKIEITTSTYFHSIVPLTIDTNCAQKDIPKELLPQKNYKHPTDVKTQIKNSIKKYEDIFEQQPKGFWPPEHAVSDASLKMLKELGFEWTLTDEGILAKSLKMNFEREFDGTLQNPYFLSTPYTIGNSLDKTNNIKIVFNNTFFANLINFQYSNHGAKEAAEDLYQKIKSTQQKLQQSPDKHHIITIALDGENCWEHYKDNGKSFLNCLYSLLEEDETLDISTISEFLKKKEKQHYLEHIYPGTNVNSNFQMWISDPIKNLAWEYLYNAKEDLLKFTKENIPSNLIEKAKKEFSIIQGSDWFWWFGEPNDSGKDEVFDYLFRNHLKQIYKILKKPSPEMLEKPLEVALEKKSYQPKTQITPNINGILNNEEWKNAGYVQIVQGALYNSEKLFSKMYFGHDSNNIYLRFDLNNYNFKKMQENNGNSELILYFQSYNNEQTSHIRYRQLSENESAILKYAYTHEIEIPMVAGKIRQPVFSKALDNFLWGVSINHRIELAFSQIIEVKIPFDDIKISQGQKVNMAVLTGRAGILEDIVTKDRPISFVRPDNI